MALKFEKGAPGFEALYSFNGSALDGVNNMIFMQGLPGLNYLVAESDAADPQRDPRVPGKQQSVISFTKKLTPEINIPAGDGFPSEVYFNGEECSLLKILPTSGSYRLDSSVTLSFLLGFLAFVFVQQ